MEIAIAVIFLALFLGAGFLAVLLTVFVIWRKAKRRNRTTVRQFEAKPNFAQSSESFSDDHFDETELDSADEIGYSNSAYQNTEAEASMSFESSSEGGESAPASSDYSDSSSSDSSSGGDSGSSSSWD